MRKVTGAKGDNGNLERKFRVLVIAVIGLILVVAGLIVFSLFKPVDGATSPGTCLPESKGGTNCDPSVVKSMYESNEDTNVYTDQDMDITKSITEWGPQKFYDASTLIAPATGSGSIINASIYVRQSQNGRLFKIYGTIRARGPTPAGSYNAITIPGALDHPPTQEYSLYGVAINVVFNSSGALEAFMPLAGTYIETDGDIRLWFWQGANRTEMHFPMAIQINENFGN